MNLKYLLTAAAVVPVLLSASLAFTQQAGGAAPGNKKVLMICGDENGTSLVCTSVDDITLKNRLENTMGEHVQMMPHDTPAAEMLAAANAADLVIIVESVNSGSVGFKLVNTPTPIVTSEAFLQDEFGLVVPPFAPVDPGYPEGVSEAQLRAAAQLLEANGLMLNVEVPPAATAPAATPPAGRGAIPPGPAAIPSAPGAVAAAPGAAPAAPGAAPGAAPAGRGGIAGGRGGAPGGRGGRGGAPGGRGGAASPYTTARNEAIAKAVTGKPTPSHGVTTGQISLVIADPTHPLAAGLSGRVQVYREPREMNWGNHLAPGAKVVATLAPSLESAGDEGSNAAIDRSKAAVIYYVPKGGELAQGAKAAGLRVQLFVENENGPGTYNLMTPEGFRIFDAAINWALTQK